MAFINFIVVVVAVHSLNCTFKNRDHLSGLCTKQGIQRFIKVKQVLKLNLQEKFAFTGILA